jgi:hypothetical protein
LSCSQAGAASLKKEEDMQVMQWTQSWKLRHWLQASQRKKAEFIALMRALQLAAEKTVNIYRL